MQKYFTTLLVVFATLSSILSPSFGKGPGMPEGESPTVTLDATGGQTNLPTQTTVTRDKAGNMIVSVQQVILSVPVQVIKELIPKDATEKEKETAFGYILGYAIALKWRPEKVESYIKSILNETQMGGADVSNSVRAGFLMGVQAALESQDIYEKLFSDTLEALGSPRIDQLPQLKVSPPITNTPKPNAGPT